MNSGPRPPRPWLPHEITQGTTDELLGPLHSTRRIATGLAPIDDDEQHACYLCGYQGRWPAIRRTVPKDAPTRIDYRCTDTVACLRRRNR